MTYTKEKAPDMKREQLRRARSEQGISQQAISDILEIDLRYYQKIESGESIGAVWIWDVLEDTLGVNQRTLRGEIKKHPDLKENQ